MRHVNAIKFLVWIALTLTIILVWFYLSAPSGDSLRQADNEQGNTSAPHSSSEVTDIAKESITFDKLSPEAVKTILGMFTVPESTSTETSTQSPQTLPSEIVRLTTQPALGAMTGTFEGGFTVSKDAVALGEQTTGAYVKNIVAGDGLQGDANGEGSVSMLAVGAGDGIAVDGDSVSVFLQPGGGMDFASGALGLVVVCADSEVLKWDGTLSQWQCGTDNVGIGGSLTVKEADGTSTVATVSTIEFGPASGSSDEFIVTDQGAGAVRVRTGSAIPLANATTTISGGWTFSSEIVASGGLTCTSCVALGSETSGDYVAGVSTGSGLSVSGSGGEGSTPTVSLDSSLAIFKTIDASLGTDPVADSLTDTLSLTSGNGVNVTGDATTDNISFGLNLASGSGLTFNGSALSLLNTCGNGEVLKWNTTSSAWECGAGSLAVKETDGSPTIGSIFSIEFGPATGSSDEFVVTNQGAGTARIRTGSAIPLSNATATISGAWTFSADIVAGGGLSCTSCVALGSETSGDYVAGVSTGSGLSVSGSGGEGSTPTVSLDSSLAIFKTVDASLGTDPVADSLTDTLSLTSGNGVNVTGDSTTDSISFGLNLASGSGLTFNGSALSLLNSCGDGQVLAWSTGSTSWICTSIAGAANQFSTIGADSGSATADTTTDTVTFVGGNGLTTSASDSPDTITLNIDLASGSGLAFSGGALSLMSCSDGQILKVVAGAWACASDSTSLAKAMHQHFSGTNDTNFTATNTALLKNAGGTATALPITIASGNYVEFIATIEASSSLAAGPVTYSVVRDDNLDNDCVTTVGDGTRVGGWVDHYLNTPGQGITTSFTFIDTAPGTTTPQYQLCASTTIATGVIKATDRTLVLREWSP